MFFVATSLFVFPLLLRGISGQNLTLVRSWNALQWVRGPENGRDANDRDDADQRYIPENNLMADAVFWKSWLFAAVPRWKRGVPATLAKIDTENEKSLLEPYPTWGMQREGDCYALQNVHAVALTGDRLWVLDNGVSAELETLQQTKRKAGTVCSAKLVVIDLSRDLIVRTAAIPTTSPFSTFAVDGRSGKAYIVNAGEKNSTFIVYDYGSGIVRRYACQQLNAFRDAEIAMFSGIPAAFARASVVSLALNEAHDKLYFCHLKNKNLYSVPLSAFAPDATSITKYVENRGKKGRSAAVVADEDGSLFFDILGHKAVAKWNQNANNYHNLANVVVRDEALLPWVAAIFFDARRNLWVVTNTFEDFVQGYTDAAKENVKIFTIDAESLVFIGKRQKRNNFNAECVVLILFLIVVSLVILEIFVFKND